MAVIFPGDLAIVPLTKDHPRKAFSSGEPEVDQWLQTQALQNQKKHLSSTRVLIADGGAIAGYFTLASGQVDFGDLPTEMARKLPRRALPVAVLAWLGVDQSYQGQGLGARLFAQALADCHRGGEVFSFIAVIIDCINDDAKRFYERWEFRELPGNPYRLFITVAQLEALMA